MSLSTKGILRKAVECYFKCLSFCMFLSFILQLLMEIGNSRIAVSGNQFQKCQDLLMGQYLCPDPDIDHETQQARGCNKETLKAPVWCAPAPGIICDGLHPNGTFKHEVSCKWTNGHSFETSLLLSIFLGMFGVDRFYLGYPAIGLVKFATLGLMFIGQLIDILLIATQVLTPADGSAYVIDYFGTATVRVLKNNETFLKAGQFCTINGMIKISIERDKQFVKS